MKEPRTLLDDASEFFSTAIRSPISFFSGGGPPSATPDEVFNGDIDLKEDEVLEQDRGEEGETDDCHLRERKIRMLTVETPTADDNISDAAKKRRCWEITPLRLSDRRTGGI